MRLKASEAALAIVVGLTFSCTHAVSPGGDGAPTGGAGTGAGGKSPSGGGAASTGSPSGGSSPVSGTGGFGAGGNFTGKGSGGELAGTGGGGAAPDAGGSGSASGAGGCAGTGGCASTGGGAGGVSVDAGVAATGGTSGLAATGGEKGGSGATGADAGGLGGAAAPRGGTGGGTIPGEKKSTVTAPASSTASSDYFVMGETRLINNNWGAQSLGCKAPYQIFVNADKTFGWKWDRASITCGGGKAKPDYPEVEFGIHPFGSSKQLVTSPDYSSTTVLPIQVKDVKMASVTIEGLSMSGSDKAWNMNFEMWFDDQNPVTGNHKTAYGETMNWFGWSSDQYNWSGVIGTLDAGQKYNLYLSREAWPDGQAQQWKYRQYRAQSSSKQFNGTVDVKKILDHLTTGEGWPTSLWIARFEVGTELDDGSSGTVTIKKITFEVNGEKRETEIH